ncbi:Histidine ammonia-lyase [Baekduia alba]|uniref:aromatic amino acid lyase n=1 Tax=Baekduia alba TaxID=2997333 RepID=UPI0023407563|nr:aromatic amino acid lyase [Baekduia alba]WCB91524.1 Histidine ammonia-lyase [Baekduia alba]
MKDNNAGTTPASFRVIVPTRGEDVVRLDGTRLTVDEVVMVARHGAQVVYSPEAIDRAHEKERLLLAAVGQGRPVYWVTRGTGKDRKITTYSGDPFSEEGRRELEDIQLRTFRGESPSLAVRARGPEIGDEETVRAVLVVAANTLVRRGASAPLLDAVVALLNHRVAPVLLGRGSPGQGDLPQMSMVAQTLVGEGTAYHQGRRMPAREALREAGLPELVPFGIDSGALIASNAFSDGQAALLVADAETMLNWADLVHVLSKLALNDSVTPLLPQLQSEERDKHQAWLARRVAALTRGSHLWEYDAERTLQGPLSFRDYFVLGGVAWKAWDRLRQEVERCINTPGQNPALLPNLRPQDSWALDTGWLRQFLVQDDEVSGYVVASAGFERRGLDQEVGAFANALAWVCAGAVQRPLRLQDPFVNALANPETVPHGSLASRAQEGDYAAADLYASLLADLAPLPPMTIPLIRGIEDLSPHTHAMVRRVRNAVDTARDLVAEEAGAALAWLEVRRGHRPDMKLGPVASALLDACAEDVVLDGSYPDRPAPAVSFRAWMATVDPRAFMGPDVQARPDLLG